MRKWQLTLGLGLLTICCCGAAALGMEGAAAGTQCPLSQASLVVAKMVIDDVTDVPGCGGEDLNRLTVDTNGIGADPGYGELKGTTPKTVAGAGCVHHLFLNGKDAGVTCPGATSIVVLGQGRERPDRRIRLREDRNPDHYPWRRRG